MKFYPSVLASLVLQSFLSRNLEILAFNLSETASSNYPSRAIMYWSGTVEELSVGCSSSLEFVMCVIVNIGRVFHVKFVSIFTIHPHTEFVIPKLN